MEENSKLTMECIFPKMQSDGIAELCQGGNQIAYADLLSPFETNETGKHVEKHLCVGPQMLSLYTRVKQDINFK